MSFVVENLKSPVSFFAAERAVRYSFCVQPLVRFNFSVTFFSKLTSRQRELLEELREEEERLEGKSSPSRSRSKKEDQKESGDAWCGGREEDQGGSQERSGIGGFMQDAFDRVKTHLAGKTAKENASGSSS